MIDAGAGVDPVVALVALDLLDVASDPLGEIDGVVSGAAGDLVVAGSGIDGVVAERPEDLIVARAAEYGVGKAAAEQRVVTSFSVDEIQFANDAAQRWPLSVPMMLAIGFAPSCNLDDQFSLPERTVVAPRRSSRAATITRIALAEDQAVPAVSQHCRQPTECGASPHPRRHRRRPIASHLLPPGFPEAATRPLRTCEAPAKWRGALCQQAASP